MKRPLITLAAVAATALIAVAGLTAGTASTGAGSDVKPSPAYKTVTGW